MLWRGSVDPQLLSRATVLASVAAFDRQRGESAPSVLLSIVGTDLSVSVAPDAHADTRRPGLTVPPGRAPATGVRIVITIPVTPMDHAASDMWPLALHVSHQALLRALRRGDRHPVRFRAGDGSEVTELVVTAHHPGAAPSGITIHVPSRDIHRSILAGPGGQLVRPSDAAPPTLAAASRKALRCETTTATAQDLYEASAIATDAGTLLIVPAADAVVDGIALIGASGTAVIIPRDASRNAAAEQPTQRVGAMRGELDAASSLIALSPNGAGVLALALRAAAAREEMGRGSLAFVTVDDDAHLEARVTRPDFRVAVRDDFRLVPQIAVPDIRSVLAAIATPVTAWPSHPPSLHVRLNRTDFAVVLSEALHAAATRSPGRERAEGQPHAVVIGWSPRADTAPPPTRDDVPTDMPREATRGGLDGGQPDVTLHALDAQGALQTTALTPRRLVAGDVSQPAAVAIPLSMLAELAAFVGTPEIELDVWADVVRIADRSQTRSAVLRTVPAHSLDAALRLALDGAHPPFRHAPLALALAVTGPSRWAPDLVRIASPAAPAARPAPRVSR